MDSMILILMHFYSFVSKLHKAACHQRKCDIINDVKLLPSQNLDVIQLEVELQKQVH